MRTQTGGYVLYFEFPGEVFVSRPREAWLQSPLLYVGSALGPAGFGRITRHLRVARGEGKVRWHVDQLLRQVPPRRIYLVPSREPVECDLARLLGRRFPVALAGFGSSDCRCPGHLFQGPWFELEQLLHDAGFAFVRLCSTGSGISPGWLGVSDTEP